MKTFKELRESSQLDKIKRLQADRESREASAERRRKFLAKERQEILNKNADAALNHLHSSIKQNPDMPISQATSLLHLATRHLKRANNHHKKMK